MGMTRSSNWYKLLLADFAAAVHGKAFGKGRQIRFAVVEGNTAQRRATQGDDGRDIESGRGHHHPRYDLVTRTDHDQPIKAVR